MRDRGEKSKPEAEGRRLAEEIVSRDVEPMTADGERRSFAEEEADGPRASGAKRARRVEDQQRERHADEKRREAVTERRQRDRVE